MNVHLTIFRISMIALFPILSVKAEPAETSPGQDNDISVSDWEPDSQLVVPSTSITKAKYPIIDVHMHGHKGGRKPSDFLAHSEVNVSKTVLLAAPLYGETFKRHYEEYVEAYPKHFVVFCSVLTEGIGEPGYIEKATRILEADHKLGAIGIGEVMEKGFGLGDYPDGERIFLTDPYFDPIWRKATELGMPVNIHVADPIAFYQPLDEHNEQWVIANRYRMQGSLLGFDELIDRRNTMLARNPETTFICCHLGNLSHDLGRLAVDLDAHRNMYVDISARTWDLGRQPKTARAFFIRYQDRILFGTDLSPGIKNYISSIRLFETDDEYFVSPGSARHWRSYGISLPDKVLRKLYNENAKRIIPGL
jgi:uncharacterized protein